MIQMPCSYRCTETVLHMFIIKVFLNAQQAGIDTEHAHSSPVIEQVYAVTSQTARLLLWSRGAIYVKGLKRIKKTTVGANRGKSGYRNGKRAGLHVRCFVGIFSKTLVIGILVQSNILKSHSHGRN